MLPALTGGEQEKGAAAGPASLEEVISGPGEPAVQTSQASAAASTATATPPAATGTAVGKQVALLRGELDALNGSVAERRQGYERLLGASQQALESYFATEAAIAARLKIGTTPGNPVLLGQWNSAEADLDRLAANLDAIEALGGETAEDSAGANALIEQVRATYALQGGIEEDHRQLQAIEDDASKSIVAIDRLGIDTRQAVDRYRGLLVPERDNLAALSAAIQAGEYFYLSSGQRAAAPGNPVGSRKPLVVIRFKDDEVQYREALRQAVSATLERRPDSGFDVVAVAPAEGSPSVIALETNNAKRNAERVRRSLLGMGMPASRLTLSDAKSADAAVGEVHVYIR
ncbi:MAG: hypothetical protein AB7P52_05775 [Alphaproteobacteria bacterium]